MHYLVKLRTGGPNGAERVADRDDVYLSPEGDRGWAIVEADDEESLRHTVGETEEVHPVLPAAEYRAIHEARRDLENSKARFVDDPSGALEEARRSVGRALEARRYPPPERADEAPGARREILQEYRDIDAGGSGKLEDQRNAFSRLSDLLDRLARA